MKKTVVFALGSVLGTCLAFPALAVRDAEAPMSHDFDSYYQEGVILPTADDTTLTYGLVGDLDHREGMQTPVTSFEGMPDLTIGDNDEMDQHMGDPLK